MPNKFIQLTHLPGLVMLMGVLLMGYNAMAQGAHGSKSVMFKKNTITNEFISEWTRLVRTQGATGATEAGKMTLANLNNKLPLCAVGRTPNQLESSDA